MKADKIELSLFAYAFFERMLYEFRYCDAKGYGFIIPDGQDREVFVHFRSIEMPGRKTLQTNQRVEFEFEQSERGLHATRVVPLPMKTEDAAS